jgi:hypothetical protein
MFLRNIGIYLGGPHGVTTTSVGGLVLVLILIIDFKFNVGGNIVCELIMYTD